MPSCRRNSNEDREFSGQYARARARGATVKRFVGESDQRTGVQRWPNFDRVDQ